MYLKKLSKTFSRSLARLILQICSLITKFLPWEYFYVFAQGLANIGFLLLFKHRRIALRSLSVAFGREKTTHELRAIAKDCFAFIAKAGLELLFFKDKPEMLKKQAIFENRQILDEALSKKKGVILVTGHFGNFPLMMLRLALEGYSVEGIMRSMRDQQLQRMFIKEKYLRGLKIIYSQPRKTCVEAAIRALRNNEIVVIQLDQNFGTGGIFVNFFGLKAATAAGPVVLALRSKASILPCFIVRQDDNSHRIIFEQEFNLRKEQSLDRTIMVNIQRLTEIIESYIRRYPAQWSWMHRRWKTRPKTINKGG